MTHFTVMVRVSNEALASAGNLMNALDAQLAPYNSNTKDARYLSFKDIQDSSHERYATENIEMWRNKQTGALFYQWDDCFRPPNASGLPNGGQPTSPPSGFEVVDMPYRVLFASFADYMSGFESSKLDPQKGRYGYWHNENGLWNWWKIGGRWTGFFPLRAGVVPRVGEATSLKIEPRAGHGDIVKIADLDLPELKKLQTKYAREFWNAWNDWLANPTDVYESPRARAIDLGFLRVEEKPYVATANEIAIPWTTLLAERVPNPRDQRNSWTDVVVKLTEEKFFSEYEDCFHPLIPYAAVDEHGWYAGGTVGAFGANHSEVFDSLRFQREFVRHFIEETRSTDTLVLLDCHA